MRISFLLTKCTPDNGHGRYVIELARRLAENHSIKVYAGEFWRPLQSIATCRLLPVLQRPAFTRLASLWVGSLVAVDRDSADIVHVQGADAPIGNVVTAHYCNEAVRALNDSNQDFYQRFNSALGSAVEKHCFTRSSARRIIAVSNMVREEIVALYGVDAGRVNVLHHGVDIEAFHPANRDRWRDAVRESQGVGVEEFVVLFVGGDYQRKGLLTLLGAIRQLPKRVKVIAVGIKPDARLATLLSEQALQTRISLVAPTVDVAPFYAAADCFVLPTRYDTFSLATLEAMASGLPVVVSRRAGVCEILSHQVDSLLLEDPANSEELARILSGLLTEEPSRVRLGVNARVTATWHSWDRVVRETLEVYREVATLS